MRRSPRLNKQAIKSIWTNPLHFIACGFGVGASPWMPGTLGTLLGVGLYKLLVCLPLPLYALATILLILIGIPLCAKVNRDFGTHDHPAAVWDEIATFPLVMLGLPNTLFYLVLGFALFRLFDIWKPGPIGWVDRHVHGGVGVMLDDVLAALFAWGVLFSIYCFL